ncbi:DNA-binding response regulator [Parafrankia soli]|uniref:DNA-binding response regulator n=1 Tax=Parafrankia soli TaxID=2599596 RepID=A0A1S1PWJ7_9ACTN|nr:response regulator transcription factor [Parafrankia soli]OHV25679.1 DNA-binding response regulator [Parafrankia soli]
MTSGESTAPVSIRVFVVDDHAVVRRGIRAFFELLDDMEVVGEAADGQACMKRLAAMATDGALPDVVLMDLILPTVDGITTTTEIKKKFPAVAVVVLTSFREGSRVRAALAAGASGYLLKDAEADEVAAAVRAAYRGEIQLDAAVTRALTDSLLHPDAGLGPLTAREREVIALLGTGKSNREIGEALTISERTARTHVSNMLAKLGLESRTQAALWAVDHGLVVPSNDR